MDLLIILGSLIPVIIVTIMINVTALGSYRPKTNPIQPQVTQQQERPVRTNAITPRVDIQDKRYSILATGKANITFAVRGNSMTPRYNGTGGPSYAALGTSPPVASADASAIGGFSIDQTTVGAISYHQIHYNGVNNWPTTKGVSILHRYKCVDNTAITPLWMCCGGGRFGAYSYGGLQLIVNSTNFVVGMSDEFGLTGINGAAFAHGGLSNDTWYDVVVTFTGDTTTNGCTVYLNGSSLGSTTSSRSWDDPRLGVHRALVLGANNNSANTYIKTNEFVLWNTIIDPTDVTLTSGTGSLNGASRTAFVDVDAIDGAASSGGLKRITTGAMGLA